MTDNVPITVKAPSDTRWEARIDSVKPLRYCIENIMDDLHQLEQYAIEKKDGSTVSEASSLTERISSWPFIISIVRWNDILFK